MADTNTDGTVSNKYLLKTGRQTIDYIDDAGLAYGFCIGRAVQCRYKAGIEPDEAKREKLIRDCNWYIDQISRRKNIVREEIVDIVKSIVARMEKDTVFVSQSTEKSLTNS